MKVHTLIMGKMKVCTLIMGKMKVCTLILALSDISELLLLFSIYVKNMAGEPENFLLASAPAPDFYFKQLQLLNFFPSGSGSWFFLSGSGSDSDSCSEESKTPSSDQLLTIS